MTTLNKLAIIIDNMKYVGFDDYSKKVVVPSSVEMLISCIPPLVSDNSLAWIPTIYGWVDAGTRIATDKGVSERAYEGMASVFRYLKKKLI